MKKLLPLALTLLVLFNGCKPTEETVTREEALKLSSLIANGAKKHKADFLTTNIIFPALIDRIEKAKNIKISSDVKKGMKTGLKKNDFEKSLFNLMGKNGNFEMVKCYEKDGFQRLIFRAFGEGINYMDLELTKLDDRVGIADIYVYITGENISSSMAELYNRLINVQAGSVQEAAAEKITLIKQLMSKNNYQQAKREFDRLPGSVQSSKLATVMRLQIISNLGDTAYAKELQHYEKQFAGYANIQLALIDMYILNKNYDKALGAINQIDSIINKDPFLDYYRGLIRYNKGDTATATKDYEKVIVNFPTFASAWEQLFLLYADTDKEKAKSYYQSFKRLDKSSDNLNLYETMYPFVKE